MLETPNKPDIGSSVAAPKNSVRLVPLDDNEPGNVNWLALTLVLVRAKKQILLTTAAALLLAVIVSFLMPSMYTGTTTMLPPQQGQSAVSSMLGQFGAIAGLTGQDWGLKNPADLFVEMLKSRTIADHLVDRFDLRKGYRVKLYQDARKELASRSKIDASDEGLITISVADRDPARAAAIANAYVEELHALNSNLALGEAAQRRLFYEQKLSAESEARTQAELQLKQAEEKSGFVQPDAQGKAMIEAVADMRAKIAMQQVQLQSMRTFATENNPEVKRAEQTLAGMQGQLGRLERSSGELGKGGQGISTRQLPEAQLDYVRRARDLKYHEALYEFLGKQLEAARIDEARNAVVIQVVDKAVQPEKRSSPHRLLIIIVTGAVAFVLACLWALIAQALRRRQQDPDASKQFMQLRQSLRFSS